MSPLWSLRNSFTIICDCYCMRTGAPYHFSLLSDPRCSINTSRQSRDSLFIVTLVVLHVNGSLFVALALVGVISCVTVIGRYCCTAIAIVRNRCCIRTGHPCLRLVCPSRRLLHKYVVIAGFAVIVTLVVMRQWTIICGTR